LNWKCRIKGHDIWNDGVYKLWFQDGIETRLDGYIGTNWNFTLYCFRCKDWVPVSYEVFMVYFDTYVVPIIRAQRIEAMMNAEAPCEECGGYHE
jgi:hypothetical protein